MARPVFPSGAQQNLGFLLDCQCDQRVSHWDDPESYTMSGLAWSVYPQDLTQPDPNLQVRPVVAFQTRPLDRISVWITNLIPKSLNAGLPPTIRIRLRLGFNFVTTLALDISVQPPSWDAADMLFQQSGLLFNQAEIWASTLDGGAGRPAVEVEPTWAVILDSSGCCTPTTVEGPWVVP